MDNTRTAPVELWFRRVGKISVGAVLFLILVGGIVRSSGSGMGCPDWPKCFGLLVPPTDASEIPEAFFETHPGFERKAFNVVQTWTEYVNRLVGATIGLLMLTVFALSLTFWRRDRRVTVLSFLAMVMTGVEAWLGKLVVDKNLEGGMVTLHMLLAILIVGCLILAVYLAVETRAAATVTMPARLRWLGLAVVVLTVVQILLGTQVREQVDEVGARMLGQHRELWLQSMEWQYTAHRAVWILVVGMAVVWAKGLMAIKGHDSKVRRLAMVMLTGFASEVMLGILLSSMDLPPVLQPLHLLFANVIFAVEFALLIHVFGVERLFATGAVTRENIAQGKFVDAKH